MIKKFLSDPLIEINNLNNVFINIIYFNIYLPTTSPLARNEAILLPFESFNFQALPP